MESVNSTIDYNSQNWTIMCRNWMITQPLVNIRWYKYRTFRRMQRYVVEFFGTTLFVYIILATGNALAIGATLALLILLMSGISGGHVNPAVSIVMAAAGKLPTSDLVPYCVAQILGGLVALEIYKRVRF